MKTIQVTPEMYDKLMSISKELNTQNHRCTKMPYMLQVSKKREVAAHEGCGETFWFGEGGEKLESPEDEEKTIKEFLFDKHGDNYESIYIDLEDYEKEDIFEELNYRKLEVTTEDEFSDFFFTEKGLRDYHGKHVNTFLTGIDNPEMKVIMTFLCELSGGKLHQ